ncbi:MAG: hypothetical protein M1383_01765 [Patescibacteria group bacterium]|nr:hypothetical protein [Patescibacteria group bacterium]
MPFELLGFDNPYGKYPAPVIPVGKLDGQLVAVYPGGTKHFNPIPDDSVYVHLPEETVAEFADFNPLTERLFADDETDFTCYKSAEEAEYFTDRLQDSNFCLDDPGMREVLTRVANGTPFNPQDDITQDPNWLEFQRLIADSNWYASHFGKCIAISGGKLIGVYASKEECFLQSRQGHGTHKPTFLMVVGEENEVVEIPTPLEIVDEPSA